MWNCMFFHFEMCEKRLHHIFNHRSDLKYLSWSLVIYRLEVIVMYFLWVLIGSSGYLSWFWLAVLKLGFGSWHSIQNLSFQKQLSFTYWPRSFLWISLTSKDKQARPNVLSHNRKKVKQRDFEICKKQSQTTKKDERWWWEKDDLF